MRFGLLGTGHWATHAHAPALVAHPDVELVGVWGRDPAKTEALAGKVGARAFADVADLLDEVAAVAIALPPDVQVDLAVQAAAAGRHLLLEKPIALRVEEADRMVSAVDAAGVASVVFFTRHFVRNTAHAVARAATGTWSGARVWHLSSILTPDNPYRDSQWRLELGGLWDVGPHALSMVLPVLGPVEDVVSMAGPDRTTYLLLRHASGAVSSFALSVHVPIVAKTQDAFFYGPEGVVQIPRDDEGAVPALTRAITELIASAAMAVPSHPCDVHFGREVVAILDRAQAGLSG
jgi:predicted dehydrogenase